MVGGAGDDFVTTDAEVEDAVGGVRDADVRDRVRSTGSCRKQGAAIKTGVLIADEGYGRCCGVIQVQGAACEDEVLVCASGACGRILELKSATSLLEEAVVRRTGADGSREARGEDHGAAVLCHEVGDCSDAGEGTGAVPVSHYTTLIDTTDKSGYRAAGPPGRHVESLTRSRQEKTATVEGNSLMAGIAVLGKIGIGVRARDAADRRVRPETGTVVTGCGGIVVHEDIALINGKATGRIVLAIEDKVGFQVSSIQVHAEHFVLIGADAGKTRQQRDGIGDRDGIAAGVDLVTDLAAKDEEVVSSRVELDGARVHLQHVLDHRGIATANVSVKDAGGAVVSADTRSEDRLPSHIHVVNGEVRVPHGEIVVVPHDLVVAGKDTDVDVLPDRRRADDDAIAGVQVAGTCDDDAIACATCASSAAAMAEEDGAVIDRSEAGVGVSAIKDQLLEAGLG